MAGSINKVILIGNVGADPEFRRFASGDQVANLRVATSESWTDRQTGERRSKTEWHSVVVFNEHLVKIIEQYVKKGAKVYIEGQIQTRKWQDQNGQDRYTTEIVLQRYRGDLQLLDSRNTGASEHAPFGAARSNDAVYDDAAGAGFSTEADSHANAAEYLNDEIPF